MKTESTDNICAILFDCNRFYRSELVGMTDAAKLVLAEKHPEHATIYDTLEEFQEDFNEESIDEVNNWLFFVKKGNNDSITENSKLNLDGIKEEYTKNDICMAELLANTSADGLTLEQAFQLYVRAKSWADDDVFHVLRDGEPFEVL